MKVCLYFEQKKFIQKSGIIKMFLGKKTDKKLHLYYNRNSAVCQDLRHGNSVFFVISLVQIIISYFPQFVNVFL